MRAWACFTVRPASSSYAACAAPGSADSHPGSPQATERMRPSRWTTARRSRSSSRHQVTSVVSPKVQIMAMPVPLSGAASSWATIGTSTPNSGVRADFPNSGWKRSSSGWATRATQAGSSSGRVVSIQIAWPSGPSKRILW